MAAWHVWHQPKTERTSAAIELYRAEDITSLSLYIYYIYETELLNCIYTTHIDMVDCRTRTERINLSSLAPLAVPLFVQRPSQKHQPSQIVFFFFVFLASSAYWKMNRRHYKRQAPNNNIFLLGARQTEETSPPPPSTSVKFKSKVHDLLNDIWNFCVKHSLLNLFIFFLWLTWCWRVPQLISTSLPARGIKKRNYITSMTSYYHRYFHKSSL